MHSKDLTYSINNANGKMSNRDSLIPIVPFHPGPVYKPLPAPIKQNVSYPQSSQGSINIDNIKLNFDFEKKTLYFRRASRLKHFKDQTNHFFKSQKN